MNKIKKLIALMLTILSMFLFVGCNKEDEPPTPPPYTPPSIEIGKNNAIDSFSFEYIDSRYESRVEWFKKKYKLIFKFDIKNLKDTTHILHSENFKIQLYQNNSYKYTLTIDALIDSTLTEKYFNPKQELTTSFVIDNLTEADMQAIKDLKFIAFYKKLNIAEVYFK